jgi:hypothetical protein
MVRKIRRSGGATVDIEEDGTIFVGGINEAVARKAIGMIEGLTKEVKIGEVYTGKVTRLLNFGAFVRSFRQGRPRPHLSTAEDHIDRVEDAVDVDDGDRHGHEDRQPRPHQPLTSRRPSGEGPGSIWRRRWARRCPRGRGGRGPAPAVAVTVVATAAVTVAGLARRRGGFGGDRGGRGGDRGGYSAAAASVVAGRRPA